MPVTVDLTKNKKQASFFELVMMAVFGDVEFRYFFYGGAIRGGKTYVCLTILVILCKIFPGSKWYVIRKSFATLKETTLPTMGKILGKRKSVRWNRDQSDYYCEFANESRIYFAGENLQNDPDLIWMLGLECNGIFLEQVEELSEKLLDYAIQRAGSWIIPEMPTPLILGSFNPTRTWVRKRIFDKYLDGTLEEPYFYQDASAEDNPFVTDEQWKSWKNMSDDLYKQFVGGDWNFEKSPNTFAFAYNDNVHHKPVKYQKDAPLYLSFDFNVEPITCLAAQHDGDFIHIVKEFRIMKSDIYDLCEKILVEFPDAYFVITGDATGQSRSAISKGNKNYYKIIRQELVIGPNQVKVPRSNPGVKATRLLTNSLFQKHGNLWINVDACPFLNDDLNGVLVDENGDIDKGKDSRKTHLLDCLRYYFWTFHNKFLDFSLYRLAGND